MSTTTVTSRESDSDWICNVHFRPEPGYQVPLQVSQLEEPGWQLVFRGTSGNAQDTLKAWTTGE